VAHDQVQIGGVGVGEGVDAGIAAVGGNQGDAATLEQPLDLESIPADVVLAEQIDTVPPSPIVSSRPTTCLKIPLLAIWWPALWLTPLYPSQEKPKTLMPSFSFISR
jgi:hypothetical protein